MEQCDQQSIRELAYYKWERAGCPEGQADGFWFEAENEVLCASPPSSDACDTEECTECAAGDEAAEEERLVEETLEESFPASDPPAWTTAVV